jgi:T5orf172 domain-containing protein
MGQPEPGWCYILSHPAWAKLGGTGAVKIGKTTKDPTKRALQISSASGLLVKPKVEWCCWVADRHAVEKAVHQRLGRYRLRSRRELFAVSVANARAVIEASTTVRSVAVRHAPRRAWPSRRRRWGQSRQALAAVLILAALFLSLRFFHW